MLQIKNDPQLLLSPRSLPLVPPHSGDKTHGIFWLNFKVFGEPLLDCPFLESFALLPSLHSRQAHTLRMKPQVAPQEAMLCCALLSHHTPCFT